MITSDKEIKQLIIDMVDEAHDKADYFPIDRYFLERNGYVTKISKIDAKQFVFCCFDLGSDLATEFLFLCLPEVWQDLTVDDLFEISEKFTNPIAYFSLIKFTHKNIEIDIIELVFNTQKVCKSKELCMSIKEYVNLQFNVLVKSGVDIEDTEEDEAMLGIDFDDWKYIKQKFLLDKRVKPAITDIGEMEKYVEYLNRRINCL